MHSKRLWTHGNASLEPRVVARPYLLVYPGPHPLTTYKVCAMRLGGHTFAFSLSTFLGFILKHHQCLHSLAMPVHDVSPCLINSLVSNSPKDSSSFDQCCPSPLACRQRHSSSASSAAPPAVLGPRGPSHASVCSIFSPSPSPASILIFCSVNSWLSQKSD